MDSPIDYDRYRAIAAAERTAALRSFWRAVGRCFAGLKPEFSAARTPAEVT